MLGTFLTISTAMLATVSVFWYHSPSYKNMRSTFARPKDLKLLREWPWHEVCVEYINNKVAFSEAGEPHTISNLAGWIY
jgi:hypothetical protein